MKRTPLQRAVPLKASGITQRTPRKKTCRNPACACKFVPSRMGQVVCSPACGLAIAKENQPRARKALAEVERKEIQVRKEALKSRSDHMRAAQIAFNAYIRARDEDQPCISCGRHHQGKYDAGHYRTTAASPELRFEPLNVHKQCVPCNQHKSGDILNYRMGLLERIGKEKVEWLEGPHEPKRYTIDQLKEIKSLYRGKVKALKAKMSIE